MFVKRLIVAVLCLLVHQQAFALSDFEKVYRILQDKCVQCHGAASPAANLSFVADPETVYKHLVNVTPQNQAAQAKAYQLIYPGHADRSFLFKKVNHLLPPIAPLSKEEGDWMPNEGEKLSNIDIEIIRQWINYGAKWNTEDFDTKIIEDYYIDGGLEMVKQPPPPNEGEGFQIHYGPIFLAPGEEVEYYTKYEPNLSDSTAIRWVQMFDHPFSHHVLAFKLNEYASTATAYGHQEGFSLDIDVILGSGVPLPPGTAYFVSSKNALNLNYHIRNYSATNILAADAYFNIYTVPKSSVKQEMKFQAISYDPNKLIIPPTGEIISFEGIHLFEQAINLWLLGGHTHALGQDFDVYLHAPNGQRGTQIYEGFYNESYSFNQGYYAYDHAPVKLHYPFYTFNIGDGIIYEAKYLNNTNNTVRFGYRTQDEMMHVIVQYTEGETLPIVQVPALDDFIIDGATVIYNNEYCASDTPIKLQGIPEGGTFNGAGIHENLFDPQLAGEGRHTITYTYTDITAYYTVEVKAAPPKPEINQLDNNTLVAATIPDALYQWYRNDSLLTEATTPNLSTSINGDYVLAVQYENSCTTYSDTISITSIPTSTSLTTEPNLNIQIYPNPIQETLYCLLENVANQKIHLRLLDVNGQLIDQKMWSASNQAQQLIDYTHTDLASGMYFLQIQTDKQTIVKKIIWK